MTLQSGILGDNAAGTSFASGAPGSATTAYSDPNFGFRVNFPAGWGIHADERAIQIWRPDGAEFVLVAPFLPAAGLNTDDTSLIGQLPTVFPQIFPDARIVRWTPPAAPGGSGVAALAFRGQQEWAEARVMCTRRPDGGGLLFIIAAPQSRFEADKVSLIAVLDSLQFGPPPAGSPQSGSAGPQPGSPGPPDPAAVQRAIEDAAAKLRWTRWTDPRESAFSVEVPVDWTIEGGALRFGPSDIRPVIQARSADGDTVVQTGDPNLMLFSTLTPLMMQIGQREGQVFSPTGAFQSMVANYMPSRVFARWYVSNFLTTEIGNVAPGPEQDIPDASSRQTQTLRQAGIPGQVDVAQVEFTGVSKRTNKHVSGQVLSSVTRYPASPLGGGSWSAQVLWSITTDGDAESDARKATATAVLMHLSQSFRDDPAWSAADARRQQEILRRQQQVNQPVGQQSHQMAMDSIRAAGDRSRLIAQQSDDRRHAVMSACQQRNDACAETQRHFVNYVGDRTDVRDVSTGAAWNVASGYQHYYRDSISDTVLGTDSPNNPGVDWTPLHQF